MNAVVWALGIGFDDVTRLRRSQNSVAEQNFRTNLVFNFNCS